MLNLSHLTRPSIRTLLIVPAFSLAVVACSSAADPVTESAAGAEAAESAVEVEVAAEETSDDTEALDCEALDRARVGIQGTAQQLGFLEDPESIAEFFPPGALEEMEGHIETLAPYQDVEAALGSTREGMDNLTADIVAVREGRLDDRVGDYGLSAINAMLGEIGC